MKKSLIFLALFFVGSFSVEAQDIKDFAGQWEFNCADAPEAYATGDLTISKTDKDIDVKITYTNGTTVKGKSARISNGKLEYIMYTEDGTDRINIELKIKDNKISGTAYLSSGEALAITASRKAF